MSRLRTAILASLVSVFVGIGPAVEPADAAVRPSDCGWETFRKADGSKYVCSFVDNFTGRTLDTSKWTVATSAGFSGFVGGGTCYMDSRDNVIVKNGSLFLTGRVGSTPMACVTPYRTFTTAYTGGAVTSSSKFAQAYGRFSFRAKLPGTSEAGYYGNLWLHPPERVYGPWPLSGEIDVAEYWSGFTDRVFPSLHYGGRTKADTAMTCTVQDVGKFHTYTLEWTQTEMKFYYDKSLCFTRSWTPDAPLVAPQPFDQPFALVMTQGLGPDGYNQITDALPTSGTTQIDWVKVWN